MSAGELGAAARGAVRRGAARARATTPTALARLREKPATRILVDARAARLRPRRARLQARARRAARPGPRLGRRGPRGDGGRLRERRPRRDWGDLLFAWRVCKHVVSNAIVLAKGLRTVGIGAGQMSRVDAVRIAVEKAREHGHELDGRRARLRRVLPVRGRAAGRARRGRDRDRSSRAARSATTEVIEAVRRRPARRWSSPAGATSGTERRRRRSLRDGATPLRRDSAARRGSTSSAERGEVEDALRRLHDAHALVLERVRLPHPDGEPVLGGRDTDTRVEARNRWWYANCAWDALGILAALGSDGHVVQLVPGLRASRSSLVAPRRRACRRPAAASSTSSSRRRTGGTTSSSPETRSNSSGRRST